jgi:parallel beta-helix repeat protein
MCSNDSYYGIYLAGCGSISLTNNTCFDNWCGIGLQGSNGNSLIDNICSSLAGSIAGSITLTDSNSNCLTNNTCISYDMAGIKLDSSDGNTLIDNTCSGHGIGYGISLRLSNANNVTGNTCSYSYYGMDISMSPDNRFFNNTCSHNTQYGFYTDWVSYDPGGNNSIWNNTFNDNNGAGNTYDPSHSQACDNGGGNWWNSTEGYGNYWSDWTTPDVNGDGIVDWSYNLTGSAGAKDHYPLTTTPSEPISEFGMMPLSVIVLLLMIVLTIGTRRRKA